MTLLLEPPIVRAGGKPPPEGLWSDLPENPDAGSGEVVEEDGDDEAQEI
jgi:hypothetical protein